MVTQLDNRQSRQRNVLDELSPSTNLRLDTILDLINDELTPSLRLRDNGGADRVLNIGALVVQTLEGSEGTGRKHVIPPIGSQFILPVFNGGSITFPSTTGGAITATGLSLYTSYTLTVASGQWIKVLVSLKSGGTIALAFGAQGATEAAATMPAAIVDSYNIGYISIHNTGGVIDAISNPFVYQFTGGGGGGGAGSSVYVAQTTHGFGIGDVIYVNASGVWAKAQADAFNTLGHGMVQLVPDPNSFIVQFGGTVALIGGLTAGVVYYLSNATAGALDSALPVGGSGWMQPVLKATSSNTGLLLPLTITPVQSQVQMGLRSDNAVTLSGTVVVASGKTLVHPMLDISASTTYTVTGTLVSPGGVYGPGLLAGSGKVMS